MKIKKFDDMLIFVYYQVVLLLIIKCMKFCLYFIIYVYWILYVIICIDNFLEYNINEVIVL